MRSKQTIFIGLIIILLAFLVIAGTDLSGPLVHSPRANTNVSKGILLNATFDNTALFNQNITNVTFMWQDTSTAQFVLNTTIRNTSAGQKQFVNTSFNTTLLPDGQYNLTAIGYNVTGDGSLNVVFAPAAGAGYTVNTSVVNVTVDNTPPNVTITTPSVNANVTDEANFNATINDATLLVKTVIFQFSNGSNPFNVTASNVSGSWNVTLATTRMSDGLHNFTVFANDTVENINTTQISNFTVDNTPPNVSIASVTSITSSGGTLTATVEDPTSDINSCTYSGAGTGNLTGSGSTYTATLSGLSPSTEYTAVVNCSDFLENVNQTTLATFTTSATASTSSSGGGSGTGSSGGVASNVAGQIAKKTWTSVNKGEVASVEVANGEIGVTEVSFTAPETVWGLWVKVEKKDKLPSTVKSFSKKAYKNLEITKNPSLARNALGEVAVKFKVEKSWLSENRLASGDVALFRYQDNQWGELATTQGEDDGTYVHYSAKTPGFSFFVIGEKVEKTPSASQPPVETLPEEEADVGAPSDEPVAQPEEPTPVEESKKGGMAWLWVVLAVVIVAAIGWVWSRRR